MIRVVLGAVAAAVAMFIIGFIFFATPLSKVAMGGVDDAQAAAIQSVLAANLDADGADTIIVPLPGNAVQQAMYIRGPIAMIHYNPNGFAVGDSSALIAGFVHMLVTTLILGAALYAMAPHIADFGARVSIVALFGIAASFFMHLGNPIWWHQDWGYHLYLFVADAISFIVAGGIIARWFLPGARRSDDRTVAETS